MTVTKEKRRFSGGEEVTPAKKRFFAWFPVERGET
jgi:hypothetical protein